MLTTEPVVRLENVSRTYLDGHTEVSALRGVDLTLADGECVALMGASGSGKTTLLNVVAGVDRATTGQVRVLGTDFERASERAIANLRLHRIGYVFQNVNLLPDLTLLENVSLPLEATGVRRRAARALAAARLEAVEIPELAGRFPAEVSGGERQRAAIARAVVGERSLLLADEPTGALDSDTGATVMRVLLQLCAGGVTALIGTHNPDVAAAADRTITMSDGLLAVGVAAHG